MKTYIGSTRYKVLDENGVRKSIESPLYDAEIKYLGGSGAQYIDTGFKPNQNTSIECVYNVYNNIDHRAIFGCAKAASSSNANEGILRLLLSSGQARIGFGDGDNTIVYTNEIYNRINTEYKILFDKNNVYIDDELVKTCSSNTWQSPYNLYLFARNTANVAQFPLDGYIKRFKVWDGANLVMDLNAVRIGTVGYMYDRVSRKLFGNSGTGSFILGPDASPSLPSNPVPNDEIWYTSKNNVVLVPETTGYGANLVSHTNTNGKGVMKFDGNVTTIPEVAFANLNGLQTIALPDSITAIQGKAFSNCSNLEQIQLGTGLLTMSDNYGGLGGSFTFDDCYKLEKITSLKSVAATIDNWCFHDFKRSSDTPCTLAVPSGATGYDAWKYTIDNDNDATADTTFYSFSNNIKTLEASDYLFLNN